MTELNDEVRAFLSEGTRTGKLGWVAADGRPLVAPIWFVVHGDELWFNTGSDSAKGKAIARDPRLVLTVDLEQPPYGFVQVQGEAAASTDLAELVSSATEIAARYMGPDLAEQFGKRNGVPGELLVRIVPTKVIAHMDMTAP